MSFIISEQGLSGIRHPQSPLAGASLKQTAQAYQQCPSIAGVLYNGRRGEQRRDDWVGSFLPTQIGALYRGDGVPFGTRNVYPAAMLTSVGGTDNHLIFLVVGFPMGEVIHSRLPSVTVGYEFIVADRATDVATRYFVRCRRRRANPFVMVENTRL